MVDNGLPQRWLGRVQLEVPRCHVNGVSPPAIIESRRSVGMVCSCPQVSAGILVRISVEIISRVRTPHIAVLWCWSLQIARKIPLKLLWLVDAASSEVC